MKSLNLYKKSPNVANAMSMRNTFWNCSCFTEVDISYFKTRSVTYIWSILYEYLDITYLSVKIDTVNVSNDIFMNVLA